VKAESTDDPFRRREERLLRERLQDMEAKVNVLVTEAAKLAPPAPPQSPAVTALAKAMGDKDYHFPTGSTASLDWDENEEIIASGLTIEGRFWSVEDIVKLGLINEGGLGCGIDIQPSPWRSRQCQRTI
jgi:hypothetical protein